MDGVDGVPCGWLPVGVTTGEPQQEISGSEVGKASVLISPPCRVTFGQLCP